MVNDLTLIFLQTAIFSWIAFTTTSWLEAESPGFTTHFGLWRSCSDVFGAGCIMLDGSGDATFNAVQALAIFGFGFLNAGFVLLILFIFWDSCRGNGEVSMASALLMLLSGACWLTAAIIFAAEYLEDGFDSGYSFALAIVAAIIAFIAGVLIFVARKGVAIFSS
ncbi:epithelial membrane protein 1-like [Plakobranchus ocellatus]|uniref:Epithelial membrane protein 1-like n=1 Tax=Plakobranchus ocellatus TaxID=259542 RepID=A0AAV4CZT5_9GAST|nr:epithelial membrane protein 1-like [Plakobranchus ocellatus]